MYSHSLLECNDAVKVSAKSCRRFDGLPIGTSAINIPKNLDGRTKFLANGHRKPTGGMNLNLFLSNTYPVPRNAMVVTGNRKTAADNNNNNNSSSSNNSIFITVTIACFNSRF